MLLTKVGMIWNRAVLDRGGSMARDGDVSLASLLFLHGMVMNGGLGHAVDVLTTD